MISWYNLESEFAKSTEKRKQDRVSFISRLVINSG